LGYGIAKECEDKLAVGFKYRLREKHDSWYRAGSVIVLRCRVNKRREAFGGNAGALHIFTRE
jgi:hypothetical protein